jgi:hypothetical protein
MMATFRSDSRCGEGKAIFKATLAFPIHFERMEHTTMKKVAAGLSTLCLSALLAVPAFAETNAGGSGTANAVNAAGNVAANAANAVGNVASNAANAAGNVASNAANAAGNVASNAANAVGNGVSRVTSGTTGANAYPYSTYNNPVGSNVTTKTDGNVATTNYRAYATDDNAIDWGWLGLLGLVGLAGLFGRDRSDAR